MVWENMARPIVDIVARQSSLVVKFLVMPENLRKDVYCEIFADGEAGALAFSFLRHKTESTKRLFRQSLNIPLHLLDPKMCQLRGRHVLSVEGTSNRWVLSTTDQERFNWLSLTWGLGRRPVWEPRMSLLPEKRAAFFNACATRTIIGDQRFCVLLVDTDNATRIGFRFQSTATSGAKTIGVKKSLVRLGDDIWKNPVFQSIGNKTVSFPLRKDGQSDVWYVDLTEMVVKSTWKQL